MVKYILVYLTALSSIYVLRTLFGIVKAFRKNEEYKPSLRQAVFSMLSIAYIITIIILGV